MQTTFRPVASTSQGSPGTSRLSNTIILPTGDSIPLLDHSNERRTRRNPFHRARPIWLVPFAIISSVARGITFTPRVEIYTQLSCNHLYGGHDWNSNHHTPSIVPLLTAIDPFVPRHPATLPLHDVISDSAIVSEDPISMGTRKTRRPKRTPSGCASNPEVQAGAARLQTVMTTTMGLLSALTSGWWGAFSERHGRTKVLAISTLGLLLTDLTFVLISAPALSLHGLKFLIVAPIIEGLLGGLSTLQAATFSYLSDCTSLGSRSQIFSRFTGVFYIGFFIGPSLAGYLVHHPFKRLGLSLPIGSAGIDLSPFWVAIACSFANFVMALFVFPESLRVEKRERAMARWEDSKIEGDAKGKVRIAPPTHNNEVLSGIPAPVIDYVGREDEGVTRFRGGRGGILTQFFSPLAVFLPAMVAIPGIARKRRDWSLTLLAIGLYAYTLSTGIFQMKYLYATHTYGWGVRKLSYYISLMGGLKALFLLLFLPSIIAIFKPKQPVKGITSSRPIQSLKGKEPVTNAQSTLGTLGKKPKFNRAQLGQEISFDITLARLSLLIDIIAQSLVVIAPSSVIVSLMKPHACCGRSAQSEASFIAASALNSFGAGLTPLAHSLALSLTQLRAFDGKNSGVRVDEDDSVGELFGALAALQVVGQTVFAPMLFGVIYSGTVAKFPKAIFVISGTLCLFALLMFSCVRNPVIKVGIFKGKAPIKRRRESSEMPERGRSRVSKDLRGGAIPYNPRQSYGAVDEGVAYSV